MEKQSIVKIFEEESDFETKLKNIELELNRKIYPNKTIVFIDEIQESELAISYLKSLTKENKKFKYIDNKRNAN